MLKIKRKDFLPWVERHSQTLVEHAQAMAKQYGRPYEYRQGRFKKEAFIQELIRRDKLDIGLVAVLCVQETCRSVALRYGDGKPRLLFTKRPQRVLYYYWLDANFGLMYLRLQTWFPYTMQVYFTSRDKLRELYPRLLDHAAVNFSARDILTFLGRKLHGNFQGEVLNDLKKGRHPGARIKHRMKVNWLKMYDKFGLLLHVETVINNPREFKVRRRRERDGRKQMVWCPMNKGVSNLPSYQRVAHAANERYLDALSVVADPTPAYAQVAHVAEPKVVRDRHYAGFNPARRDDVRLFQAVLSGDHLVRGFHNADVRTQHWPAPRDPAERRRQMHRASRLLKRLHVRGLLAKIPRTRRWRVTHHGQVVLGKLIRLHYHGLAQAA